MHVLTIYVQLDVDCVSHQFVLLKTLEHIYKGKIAQDPI